MSLQTEFSTLYIPRSPFIRVLSNKIKGRNVAYFSPQMKSEWDNKNSCAACLPQRQPSAQQCYRGHILLLISAAAQRHMLHRREHRQGQVGRTCVGCKIFITPVWCKWTWTVGISPSAEGKLDSLGSLLQLIQSCVHTTIGATSLRWCTGRTPHSPVLLQWCLSLRRCRWSQALRRSSSIPRTFTENTCLPRGYLRQQNRWQTCARVHAGACIRVQVHKHMTTFPHKSPNKLDKW